MSVRGGGLLVLLAAGCLWTGGAGSVAVLSEGEVVRFAAHVERFYRSLEGRSLDVHATFEDAELRSFFDTDQEFADYYAGLADRVRGAGFRYGRPLRVEVHEFRFPDPDRATVEYTLIGRHKRVLRFWEIHLRLEDTWVRRETTWVLSPERL